MGVVRAWRKPRPSSTNLPSRIRHANRRKHYLHLTVQSRILPLYRSIPYSLLLFYNLPSRDIQPAKTTSDADFTQPALRTRPLFLPCPPPRTAQLEWASHVNLRGIVARVIADANACIRLWERMEDGDIQRWGGVGRSSRPSRSLGEKIARVVYFRRLLEDGKRVAGRANRYSRKRKQSSDLAHTGDDGDGKGAWRKKRRCA